MSKPKQETPGETVARLRGARGWSAGRLARESGVPQATVSRLERGIVRSLDLRTARKLCAALGCSLAVFDAPA